MSFSEETKQELVSLRTEKSCCMLSELNALTQSCASMTVQGRGQVAIAYTTENVSVAKRVFILLKKRLEISSTPHFSKTNRFGGRRVCVIRLSPADSRKLMYALHMLHEDENGVIYRGIPRRALNRKCCQQAFLRGAFLGEGSVSSPERDHHLEFVCGNQNRANAVTQMLSKNDLTGAVQQRRGAYVVYMKRGPQISTLLGLMGATRAMMRYENALAQRSVRENVLRATVCDHNNMVRQLGAAQKQIDAIHRLEALDALKTLPDSLQELAQLRLMHPELTLEELGAMLHPPIGKSGVNHRFREIVARASQP